MVSQSLWNRLSFQLDAVATVLADAPEKAIVASGEGGAWSAHDPLAHLGRMHEVLLERLRRLLRENAPHFPDYRPEDDPEWAQWTALPIRDVLTRLQALRSELLGIVRDLSEAQLR